MTNPKSKTMTIPEAAVHYGKSEKTIRRWRAEGKINGEKIDGRWMIHPDQDNDPQTVQQRPTQNDQPGASYAETQQMRSEIEFLRAELERRNTQIDQQNQLLAMAHQEKETLIQRLPPERRTIVQRMNKLLDRFRKEDDDEKN